MPYLLQLLGPFAVQPAANGGEAASLNRKTRAILAYLATTGRRHSRRALWALFCQTTNDPAGNLRWHLSRIRRQLDPEILDVTADDVACNTAVVRTDLATFQKTLSNPTGQTTEALAEAVDLYRGPFLNDLDLRQAPEFDLWLLAQRTRTQQLYEKGGMALASRYIQKGAYDEAISLAQLLLQTNALLETIHQQLVWLYAHTGRRSSALKQFESCRQLLQEELAVEPARELLALHTAVVENEPLPPIVANTAPAPEIAASSPARAEFVGRAAELQRLGGAWTTLRQRGGATFLIDGVAGAGKTRLVQEFFQTAFPGARPLQGNCYESTRTISYQPWLAILEGCVRQLRPSALNRLAPQWQAQLGRLLPQTFPATAGVPEKQEHLFRAIAKLLLPTAGDAAAVDAPAGAGDRLFFIDDLQWADDASLQLFLFISQQLSSPQSPTLLIGTFRSEEAEDNPALQTVLRDLQRRVGTVNLSLSSLAEEEVETLIAGMWPKLPATARKSFIRDTLLPETGGNPLFLTEIVSELAGTAELPTTVPVPPSLQALTGHRLRQLPASSRQVIETLAVLQRPSEFDLLRQISSRTEEETVAAVELGLRWRFLEPSLSDRYGFTHDLIGGAVRGEMSAIRRQRLHHRVATALTRRAAHPAILAHHWGAAGNRERQATFALQAGERALSRAAFGDAVLHFRSAFEVLPTTASGRRFQATLGIVRALEATSDVTELPTALATLEKLAARTGETVCRAQWARHEARFALLQGEPEKAEEIAGRGLAWAEAALDADLQAALLETIGKAHRDQGDYSAAFRYGERSLELHQVNDNRQGQAAALTLLGNLKVHQGQHREAVRIHRQALALSRQLADPFNESRILAWLADALWYSGDYDAVRTVIEEGLVVSREIGDKRGEAVQLNNLAGLAVATHSPESAIVHYGEALAIAETMNDPRLIAVYHSNIGGAYVGLGDTGAALLYLEKAIAIAHEAGLPRQAAHAHHTRGHALREAGDLVAARAAFEEALALRQELGEQFRTFLTLSQLVEICFDLDDLEAAEAHLLAAERLYTSLQGEAPAYARQMFHYVAFLLHDARGHAPVAAEHLEQAHGALQKQLAELDDSAREQLNSSRAAQTILAALAHRHN